MSDYKFDTFYFSEDESSEHHLSEIENLPEDEFNSLYKGKMYCPLCKNPKLSLVRKQGSTFLRTYPNQSHAEIDGEICFYACDTASKRTIDEYVQELREKQKIKSVLEAIMRRLLKPNNSESITLKDTTNKEKNPLIIEKIQSNKSIKRSVIPHYSFRSWGKNIPQNQLLIVYGKVYIELKEIQITKKDGNKIPLVYIHFKDIRSKKFITSCIKPQTLEVKEGNYYAVILGTCHSKEVNDYTHYNLWVNSPVEQSIILKPLS